MWCRVQAMLSSNKASIAVTDLVEKIFWQFGVSPTEAEPTEIGDMTVSSARHKCGDMGAQGFAAASVCMSEAIDEAETGFSSWDLSHRVQSILMLFENEPSVTDREAVAEVLSTTVADLQAAGRVQHARVIASFVDQPSTAESTEQPIQAEQPEIELLDKGLNEEVVTESLPYVDWKVLGGKLVPSEKDEVWRSAGNAIIGSGFELTQDVDNQQVCTVYPIVKRCHS